MTTLRQLDAALARALGVDRPPSREYAMAKVAWRYVSVTGNEFRLLDGRTVTMPDGTTLPMPAGSTYRNDRYALFLAHFLGDEIAAEVDAYRLDAPAYTTNGTDMLALLSAMRGRGWHLEIISRDTRAGAWDCIIHAGLARHMADGATMPEAVANAAARALGIPEMDRA